MNPRLLPLHSLYRSGDRLFVKALAGVTREQGLTRVGMDANPLLWIAAHLATTRNGLAQMVGLERTRPWGSRFTRGSEVGDPASIPDCDEILGAWNGVTAELERRLPQLTDAELDAPAPRDFPIDDKTLLGGVGFLAYHEAYHIGQMAIVRKALGLPGLVG